MTIRKLLTCALISLLCFSFFGPKTAHAAQTPQEFVKEFYEWYFKKDYDFSDALKQDKISKYIEKDLIEYLRKIQECHEVNYFTQMGSQSSGFENADVHVGDVLPMADDAFVVPATFKKESLEKSVVVYVHKEGGKFRISSISDAYPY